MLHKYFSYSFALRFHVPSLNKPCIIQYLVVCMCVFKKDWGEREKRVFAHICSFVCVLQTAAETQIDGSPTECCSGQHCNFVFFQEDPPHKKPKTKLVALKCPNARSFSKLMCCTQKLLLSALLQHCQTSGTLKALKVFVSITLLLRPTCLTACVLQSVLI